MVKAISDLPQYSNELHMALQKSIYHWQRICAFIKAEMYDGTEIDTASDISANMLYMYNESMYGESCPLCKLAEARCTNCVLYAYGMDCDKEHSPWGEVMLSTTMEELLNNAEHMVGILKEIFRQVVEAA